MPIKEYECRACGHKFEEILMLNEPDPTACPKCGKADLKRILSTFRVSGLHKKSASADDSMEGLDGGIPGGMPGGMPDDMDMGGMEGMGGDMGMGDDDGGELPPDSGTNNTEEPT